MNGLNRTSPIPDAPAIAARLMSEFAERTGLSPGAQDQRRYLWTDAFAVCNFLELFERTSDQQYRRCAAELIDQVHSVLGRYRNDDVRHGWISGLDEESGRHHPTAGGLRIGKPLRERDVTEPFDENLEWDRDGQYFHYLTKWMHALCQAAFLVGDAPRWAVELGSVAFHGFARRSGSGQVVGVYWKMSTDLSRPLIPASGLHDALDGFITFREVRACRCQVSGHTSDRSRCGNRIPIRRMSTAGLDNGRPARTRRAAFRCLPAVPIDRRAAARRRSSAGTDNGRLPSRSHGTTRRGALEPASLAPLGLPRARLGDRPAGAASDRQHHEK